MVNGRNREGCFHFHWVLPMDARSLFRQAEKYRRLAQGINDEKTLALLEQMAREFELRARRLQLRRKQRKRLLTGS